jgi:hypothetical protein
MPALLLRGAPRYDERGPGDRAMVGRKGRVGGSTDDIGLCLVFCFIPCQT